MAGILFTNFARSQLAAPLLAGDLSLTVETGHGARFPSPGASEYFYLVLENAALDREIVKCTSRSVDTLTIVRAQDNTTALGWNAGDIVALRMVAAALNDAIAEAAGADFALLAGAVFTGAVSVPAGATGAQVPQVQEVVGLTSATGSAKGAAGTTAQRDASPTAGYDRYNSDLGTKEFGNGTEWVQVKRQQSAVVATTSGTSHEVTGIAAYATKVEIHVDNVSMTGANPILVQLGTSAGLVAAGYENAGSMDVFANLNTTSTAGVPLYNAGATFSLTGVITLNKTPGTNRWIVSGLLARVTGVAITMSGAITLPGVLDRVGLVRTSTDSFDDGAAWVTWS